MADNAWVEQWFNTVHIAGQTGMARGGVIPKQPATVDKQASLDAVVAAARRRGWHVIESGRQVVVLCHKGVMHVHC
jgi:hypothetical protein